MLVSIIIPCYNGEKFLQEAIDSALNQTHRHIEIIVVDDGSTDTSRVIAQNSNVQVISKKNGGIASALNAGIVNAKGNFIKWLSADDVLEPSAIEVMLHEISINSHDYHKAIFYTPYTIIDENGKKIADFKESERDESYLWTAFYGNGSSSLIHRSIFKLCGLFDESLPHSEDYEFWLRATQLFGVELILIPFVTLKYRYHVGQLTKKVGGSLDKQIKASIRARESEMLHSRSRGE